MQFLMRHNIASISGNPVQLENFKPDFKDLRSLTLLDLIRNRIALVRRSNNTKWENSGRGL